MKYRKLGDTGLTVSEIGFGCWGLGGDSYGPVDDQNSIATIHCALDQGINIFDTSDAYGNGRSESVLGKALRDRRAKALIASKVGMVWSEGRQDFTSEHIRTTLNGSLQRLQTDYLDLYQLHSPSVETLQNNPEVLETFLKLKKTGTIREFGVSAKSPEDALVFIEKMGIRSIQINFNLVDQRARTTGLFESAQKHQAGIIIRTPMCFGFLTGKYGEDYPFPENDHRSKWHPDQRKLWSDSIKTFLNSMVQKSDLSAAEFALSFCLSHDAISTLIPGMLKQEEVEENAGTSDRPGFSETQLQQIYEIYDRSSFFLGKKPHKY